jgi:kynurenine formamidase
MTSQSFIRITIDGRAYRSNLVDAHNLAIALHFDEGSKAAQPNAFHLERAHGAPAEAADFIGDTRRGGSANCTNIHFNPHGNGTHTECVGHIVDEAVPVGELATAALTPAVIVSVAPVLLGECDESYGGLHEDDDRVVTRRALSDALQNMRQIAKPAAFCRAVIVRTLPNSTDKKSRTYSGANPPYPTSEAIEWLLEMGCEHVVLDLPSLDREDDGGTLPNHHRFFEVAPGAHRLDDRAPSRRTVTEMAFIPDELDDCVGLLNLQLPRFALDAAPSRPLFYAIESD